MPKNYFGSISIKSPNAGGSLPDPRLNSINTVKNVQRPYSHWTFLVLWCNSSCRNPKSEYHL